MSHMAMMDTNQSRAGEYQGNQYFAAECLIAYYFSDAGWTVNWPLTNAPYDLLVEKDGGILRLQVKRALLRGQRKKATGLSDREHYALRMKQSSKARSRRMLIDHFDYICVVCARDLVYVIPSYAVESKTNPGTIILDVKIKPESDSKRKDVQASANRWLEYKNTIPLRGKGGWSKPVE